MAISMKFVKDARALAILPLVGGGPGRLRRQQGARALNRSTVAAVPGGGAIVVETFTSSATVSALNTKDRKVTLQFADGKKTTFKASPDMVNYNQLQVGDQVNAVVTEQAVVWLSKNGGPPSLCGRGRCGAGAGRGQAGWYRGRDDGRDRHDHGHRCGEGQGHAAVRHRQAADLQARQGREPHRRLEWATR